MNKINIVTSYFNPDTDGIACSIAMAKLLSAKEGDQWFPTILGSIGDETRFILRQLCINEPTIISSFSNVNKITLVDTHHRSQLPHEFPYEKVVTIIDHHPNGDDSCFPLASITNEMVGAAASIVAKLFIDHQMLDSSILQLLGFAILSNTLNFSAPSTTVFDRNIYSMINDIVKISEEIVDRMFEQRCTILKKDMYSALSADFKTFDTKVGMVGISQIEAYNLESIIDIPSSTSALNQISCEKGLSLCLFNGVDIKTERSLVIAANKKSADLLCNIFKLDTYNDPLVFDRILLRKTDFVPLLNK